jgi:hypothetical protein
MQFRGTIVTDLRGSLDGITASRNRSGGYLRNRTKPVNPNTPLQAASRLILGNLSIQWSSVLTQEQRDDWKQWAEALPWTNKLGDPTLLTGQQAYNLVNAPRANVALSIFTDPPSVPTLAENDEGVVVTASAATNDLSIEFAGTGGWPDQDDAGLIVQVGGGLPIGRNFFNGPFRTAGVILGDGTTAPTSPQVLASPIGIIEGLKYWVRYRVSNGTGNPSQATVLPFLGSA